MIVAVVGCLHGQLEFLYDELQAWEAQSGQKVDFILCAGDFQSLRNKGDLAALECPEKYKQMGQFQRYFKKERRAPILTLFVGGNHEASNWLRDLYYGGWVAENIYFIGASGVVQVTKGSETVRIGGISGIEKYYDYLKGYCEQWPYIDDKDGLRSIYHIRQFDVQKLKLLSGTVDFMVSHEWPTCVTQTASGPQIQYLTRIKPHFKNDIRNGQLGSRNLTDIMKEIQPRFWFSAHLHVKFNTVVSHQDEKGGSTEFLSLDKPIPKRQYLDVFEINQGTSKLTSIFRQPQGNQRDLDFQQQYQKLIYRPKVQSSQAISEQIENKQATQIVDGLEEEKKESELEASVKLLYDPEWLAILKSTQSQIPLTARKYDFRSLNPKNQVIMSSINQNMESLSGRSLEIPFNEAQVYSTDYQQIHPQTQAFLDTFGLDSRLFIREPFGQASSQCGEKRTFAEVFQNPTDHKEHLLNAAVIESKEQITEAIQQQAPASKDENEIDLGEL